MKTKYKINKIRQTGLILEKIYAILKKYKLSHLTNKIVLDFSHSEDAPHLASITWQYSEYKKQRMFWPYQAYQHNPNMFILSVNDITWNLLSHEGQQHLIAHETAHIINVYEQGLLKVDTTPYSEKYLHSNRYFKSIMKELGYPETSLTGQLYDTINWKNGEIDTYNIIIMLNIKKNKEQRKCQHIM